MAATYVMLFTGQYTGSPGARLTLDSRFAGNENGKRGKIRNRSTLSSPFSLSRDKDCGKDKANDNCPGRKVGGQTPFSLVANNSFKWVFCRYARRTRISLPRRRNIGGWEANYMYHLARNADTACFTL
jgi:hypothetical protein